MSVFEHVDLPGVIAELESYIAETTPQNQSSANFITMTSAPRCGRQRALELTERVRPILDSLYPVWRDENRETRTSNSRRNETPASVYGHGSPRTRKFAGMLAGLDATPQLSASQLHELVWQAASAQWSTSHFQEAVLAAAKAVNSMLQNKLDRRDLSDVKLVRGGLRGQRPGARAPSSTLQPHRR